MREKLYVVYGENDCIYMVKATNKKEAINLAYNEFGADCNERKCEYVAKDLEKEFFKEGGFNRKVAMLY